MRKLLLLGILWLFSTKVDAQKVHAYWTNDSVLVGDKATLNIIVENAPEQMKWSRITSSTEVPIRQSNEILYHPVGEMDVIGTSKNYNKKNRSFTIICQVTAWDTANYKIPELSFEFYSRNWKKRDTTVFYQVPELTVVFVKKKVDTSITDIPLEEVHDPWRWFKDFWWIFVIVIAIPVGFYFWNKRNQTKFTSKETLKKRTLQKLAELRKKELWTKGKTEKHYVEFSFILRSFLNERYNHNFLGKTSFETQVSLRVLGVEEQIVTRIKQLLLESDFTKFGKTEPSADQVITSLNKLEELIVELSPLDLPNQ